MVVKCEFYCVCTIYFKDIDSIARRDVVMFVTSYPTPDVSFNLDKGKYFPGPITIQIALACGADDDPGDQAVAAPFGPAKKIANRWLVVGEPSTKQLLSIKCVMTLGEIGVHTTASEPQFETLVIRDSYAGADHGLSFQLMLPRVVRTLIKTVLRDPSKFYICHTALL
ncbi:hypothetical protein F4604DRAFT_849725 [Suillus subluteus]|nr:hypothetical protein F4604DRAFT_849725 [Suillus subluteus]